MSQKKPLTIQGFPSGTETGLNKAIKQICADIASNMATLKVMGLSEKRVTASGDSYPACFQSNTMDWVNLLPTDQWKPGYLFIDPSDPQEIAYGKDEDGPDTIPAFKISAAIIAYIDLSEYSPTSTDYRYSKQEFKDALINTLTRKILSLQGTILLKRIYEREIEQIFKGYSIKEVKGQYLQMPYYGIRIECEITYSGRCIT